MTVEMLKKIESRHLYQTDSSDLRLKRENLEMSVPIDHETVTRLPLVAAETLAVGYGFDRLYMVDLTTGKQTKLPARSDIIRAIADTAGSGVGSAAPGNYRYHQYRGVKYNGRYKPETRPLNDNGGIDDLTVKTLGTFHARSKGSMDDGTYVVPEGTHAWDETANDMFMTAYAGNGYETGRKPKNNIYEDCYVYPAYEVAAGDVNDVVIDIAGIESLTYDDGGTLKLKDAAQLRGLAYLYETLTPSCWDFIETNQIELFNFSKAIKDVERTLDAIYNRGRSHYGVRNQDPALHKLIISLIELGAAMRTKRFSNNIYRSKTGENASQPISGMARLKVNTAEAGEIDWHSGVVNDFFHVINDRYLVAPWWCINQLNFYDFIEDEREKERRDIDRKDAIETLHLIFQYMDMEKGLHHGSDSTLPMMLFEKFKDGVLKDFSDYTSTDAALAAALMGYRTPRDADHNVQSTTAGHVGYYAELPSAHGKLLGSEKAEFLDRITEAAEHSMLASSAEYFKEGMQLSSSFSYQAMIGRTRFGEAHCDFKVFPGGFMRGVSKTIRYKNSTTQSEKSHLALGILYFPLLGWNQYSPSASAKGFLPVGLNGASYSRKYNEVVDWALASTTAGTQVDLWPNKGGDSYWQPGRDSYSALLLKGTNDLYRTWMDRVDTISTEGVTVPSFGSINLVDEMSYDTPHAMVTRNFPILRKLYQNAGMTDAITVDDTSFDFMSAGDNIHGISEWSGSTEWKLRDRHLMGPHAKAAHHRSGALDLMPYVYASSSLPESWVDVFQLRDWMMFHTALESEPIMDAYTRNTANAGSLLNNGYINSRLVVYVDEVQENGDVRDVTCTPIVGSFRLSSEKGTGHPDLLYAPNGRIDSAAIGNADGRFSLWPNSRGSAPEYEVFLLDITRVRSEASVDGNRVSNALHLSGYVGNSNSRAHPISGIAVDTFSGHPLSEDDFVPGRGYAKLWLGEASAAQTPTVTMHTWKRMFCDDVEYLGTNALIGAIGDADLGDTLQSPNTYLGAGTEKVLTNNGLVYWTDVMGEWIQNAREGLEYSRASPKFTVFDKDILDSTESRFRQMLAPWLQSTVGPLTFVGTMDATGATHSSDTITGESRYEIISLSTGAGASAMEDGDVEAEEEVYGDAENPSVEVAEKPEVE